MLTLTRLEVFRISRDIAPAELAGESGYHRSHVLRIRQGKIEPGRDAIAAIVSALRRLSLEDVRADDVFELTVEESGAWKHERTRALQRELVAYRQSRARTDAVLRQIVASPRRLWYDLVASAGVDQFASIARAAMVEARRQIDSEPKVSEALCALAAKIAEEAADISDEYRSFLAGRAQLERANAFRQLGRYAEALPLLDAAEAFFAGVPMCTHDLGRTWFARGSILFKMDGLKEALRYLRLAINIFTAVDDQRRVARVRVVEANVRFEQRDPLSARDLWLRAVPVLEAARDRHSVASAWLNLGWCEIELGDTAAARRWVAAAMDRFVRLRSRTDCARGRWALAVLEARHGDAAAGLNALEDAGSELRSLDLVTEAGLADLDRVELVVRTGTTLVDAVDICKEAAATFERAGANQELLRALAYLAEALREHRGTPALVRRIRVEVERGLREAEYSFDAAKLT